MQNKHHTSTAYYLVLFFFASVSIPVVGQENDKVVEADAFVKAGRYQEASSLYREQLRELQLKETSELRLEILNSLASICFELGQLNTARGYLDEIASVVEEDGFVASKVIVADYYNNLGEYQGYSGNIEQAKTYFEKALSIRKGALGFAHEDTGVSYNNIGACYSYMGNVPKSKLYYDSSYLILSSLEPTTSFSFLHRNIGVWYGDQGLYTEANIQQETAVDIMLDLGHVDHPMISSFYNSIGGNYNLMGRYDLAYENFQTALDYIIQQGQENSLEAAECYFNLGAYHDHLGDLKKGMVYYKRALQIQLDISGETSFAIANIYNNIGTNLVQQRRTEEGLTYLLKSLETRNRIPAINKSYIGLALSNVAEAYGKLGDTAKEIAYHEEALLVYRDYSGEDHLNTADVYHDLGLAYCKSNENRDKAFNYLQRALETRLASLEQHHPAISLSYRGLAQYYQRTGDLPMALEAIQQANCALVPDFHPTDINQDPPINGMIRSKWELLKNLIIKIRILEGALQQTTHDEKGLGQILAVSELCSELIALIRRNDINTNESRVFLAENYLNIYGKGVEAAAQLYESTNDKQYIKRAFLLSEKSKAMSLLERLTSIEVAESDGTGSKMIRERRDLQSAISFYKRTLRKLKGQEGTREQILANTRKVDSLEFELTQVELTLEQEFPRLFRTLFTVDIQGVEEVQRDLLDQKTAVLEYFKVGSSIYVFTLTATDLHFNTIPFEEGLVVALQQLGSELENSRFFDNEAKAFNLFTNAAHSVYGYLVESPLQFLPRSIERLIIIPEGKLGYLPFGVLLKKLPTGKVSTYNSNHLSYLLEDYFLSYAYSTNYLLEVQRLGSRVDGEVNFGGFAPSFTETGDLAQMRNCGNGAIDPLQFNQAEVKEISSLFAGQNFLGTDASKQSFLEHASIFNILHVASHGCSDDADPMNHRIYLHDGYITTSELFDLNLGNDLTVLSLCEGGKGKYIAGDGMMTLATGFAYANCLGVVMGLWSIDDEITGKLMIEFYKNLRAGMYRDEALRKAKLELLQVLPESKLHPFYWSGLVNFGSVEPVHVSRNGTWLTILGAGMILLFLLLARKGRSSSLNLSGHR